MIVVMAITAFPFWKVMVRFLGGWLCNFLSTVSVNLITITLNSWGEQSTGISSVASLMMASQTLFLNKLTNREKNNNNTYNQRILRTK
jgi:hypothetical protein